MEITGDEIRKRMIEHEARFSSSGVALDLRHVLASAHQATGHERDVRRIRVAQQRDLRRRGQLSRWGRLWHLIRGVTVGHGYRPGGAGVDVAAADPRLGVRHPVRGGLHRIGEAQRVTVGGV